MDGEGGVKALLVLRHEVINVLERVVGYCFPNGIQRVCKKNVFIFLIYGFSLNGCYRDYHL